MANSSQISLRLSSQLLAAIASRAATEGRDLRAHIRSVLAADAGDPTLAELGYGLAGASEAARKRVSRAGVRAVKKSRK